MKIEATKWVLDSHYPVICRHFQFSDLYNGSWFIEILPGPGVGLFFVQEVRNGQIVKRTKDPKSFKEARKIFWDRTHKMSLEAGIESPPPEFTRIEFK